MSRCRDVNALFHSLGPEINETDQEPGYKEANNRDGHSISHPRTIVEASITAITSKMNRAKLERFVRMWKRRVDIQN